MTSRRRGLRRIAVVACVIAFVCGASIAGAQSALDGFDPGANGTVFAAAVQPDGKILVGGTFTTLGGGGTGTTTRNRIARLNVSGSLDAGFDPGANGAVKALVVQPDGKILVGGLFTTLGGGGTGTTTRNQIGRLNADGSLDASFNPGANGAVEALAVQLDGKIVVVGGFTTLGGGGTGTTTRNRLGRLNADGSIDLGFDPGANGSVVAVAGQPDGKIVVGGGFTTLGGGGTGTTTRNHVGRLNVDGSLDTGFDPGTNGSVANTLAVQPDGKILIGGDFTTLGGGGTGTTTRNRIGRLNANGSLDVGFDPGASDAVKALVVHPNGKILVGGLFTTLGGGGTGTTARNQIGRLNFNGSLDTSFDPGANGSVLALAVQSDGKIVAGGDFTTLGGGGIGTTTRNKIGRLYIDDSIDATFDPGADATVYSLAGQPDGKLLVGGLFGALGGGGTGATNRSHLGRLNADGSLDTSFNPGTTGVVVRAIVVQPDEKILISGEFTMVGGTPRSNIARLNADGTLDLSFNPGANDAVRAMALQPDGKILVAGAFTMLGGGGSGTTARNRIGRLNADGSLDTSFDPGADATVLCVGLQPDGNILVGGTFTMLGGGGTGTTTRNHIGRLNANGSLDTTFDPGANERILSVLVMPDGKILVGGYFTGLGGGTGSTTRNHIGRLNANGTLDASFDPGANAPVYSQAVQVDGKIVVVGGFTTLGGGGTGTTTRNRIGRLNADGSLDLGFDPGADGPLVFSVDVQPDGKIAFGGEFTTLGGGGTGTTLRSKIARITNTDAALQSLTVTGAGSVVTWTRTGAGPEVSRITFESSTDAATYVSLGSGTRVTNGWQLTGQSLPINQNLFIRARGYYQTAHEDGSGSIVESIQNVYINTVPIVTTGAASAVGVTTATLNGTANPGGLTTTGKFEYGLTASYGSTTATQALGAGEVAVAIGGGNVTGLVCDTVYHFRATATNTSGTTNGLDATFTTACSPPTVVTLAATSITASGATLNATVNPNGGSTTARFDYGLTTSYGSQATASPPPGSGTSPVAVSAVITGLSCNTLYHFRAVGIKGSDTNGSDLTLTTAACPPPTVVTLAATSITASGATMNGTANPHRLTTTGKFEYGPTASYGTTTVDQALGAGEGTVAIGGGALTGLACNTLYHFRATATSASGTTNGLDATFTTSACPPAPTVTTGSASSIFARGAVLNGTATPNGAPTTAYFEYGLTTSYGNTTPAVSLGSGLVTLAIGGGSVVGLTCNTPYHFRAVATNAGGTTTGADATFLTSSSPCRGTDGDVDGDGKVDLTVWRPGVGVWFWLTSSSGYNYDSAGAKQWGSQSEGDVPLLGDVDGDGKADLIVWRASTGTWYWLTSSSGYDYAVAGAKEWGSQSLGDVPLTGDIDGDGKADLIVWRASTGTWYWLNSSSEYNYASAGGKQWGDQSLGDVARVGDVDGDGLADLTVWRASTGTWYWLTSASGYNYAAAGAKQWGSQSEGDMPFLADLDGDGLADLTVWRASTGTWYWLTSASGYNYAAAGAKQWGSQSEGDIPLVK
jgi:uncharacterized delta-60 repeat protein